MDNLIYKRITDSAVSCSSSITLTKFVINIYKALGQPHSEKKTSLVQPNVG